MAASFDAQFDAIQVRLDRVERKAHRTAHRTTAIKTIAIKGLSRESQHLADKIDDVNSAVAYLDEDVDVIEEKLDGMYIRFDGLDERLSRIEHKERYSKPHVIEKKKSPRAASNASS
jgi:hypothetical protein